MFTFILGTSPLFFLLGYAAKKLSGSLSIIFNKLAATAIILIALYNLNGAIALSGSNFTFENMLTNINCAVSFCGETAIATNPSQVVNKATIYFTPRGYTTNQKILPYNPDLQSLWTLSIKTVLGVSRDLLSLN